MNIDELRQTWKHEIIMLENDVGLANSTSSIEAEARKFAASLIRRDLRETIVCIIVAPMVVYELFHSNNAISQFGNILLLVTLIFIPMSLWHIRKRSQGPCFSIKSFLNAEISSIQKQITLAKNVLWWYFLPIYFGIMLQVSGNNLARSGTMELSASSVFYLLICALFFAGVHLVNLRYVQNDLAPMLEKLQQLRGELKEPDDGN